MQHSKRKYDHLIWDFNGTLFNDMQLCCSIMNEQLAILGKQLLSKERYREIFDFPVQGYYERAGFDFSQTPYQDIAYYFIEHYKNRRFDCSLHDGIETMLALLQSQGYSHSVLSAYMHDDLVMLLKHFHISKYFIHISGSDNHYATGKIEEGKKLLAQIGIDPRKVALIGDTCHDYEVSQQLGIHCILTSCGHQSASRLLRCNVPIIHSFDELHHYLFENPETE